ncbi:hypothetical protein ACJJIK_07030 [Microbulbifer sp. ZKSA006]|uniref:hypothetical protein n=1 Tax=Microbulbifer sp. ZKSA006 TaxID=3243390 RepID=UPI0040390984
MNFKLFKLLACTLLISLSISAQRGVAEIEWNWAGHPHDPAGVYNSPTRIFPSSAAEACILHMESYNRAFDDFYSTFVGVELNDTGSSAKCKYTNHVSATYSYGWHSSVSKWSDCSNGSEYNSTTGVCESDDVCPSDTEGNPVNITTGAKVQQFRDLSNLGITFTRGYFQSDGRAAWSFSPLETLESMTVGNEEAYRHYENGHESIFLNNNDCWSTSLNRCHQIDVVDGNIEFTYGRLIKVFNSDGSLIATKEVGGSDVYYSHGEDSIVITSDGQVVEVFFEELQDANYSTYKRITSVSSGVESVDYEYNNDGMLSKVTWMNGDYEEYEYDETRNTFLTSRSINGVVYAEWEYDDLGRTIYSLHSEGTDKTSFDYSIANQVTTTNALGKKTTYYLENVGGINRVTYIEGVQSDNCAASSKSRTYGEDAFISSKTDWEGNITTYTRDSLGRELTRTEAAGTSEAKLITTEWHETYNLPRKVTTAESITEYNYNSEGRLLSKKITPI